MGIFLSVFNVHVNRSPCDGRVLSVIYKKGKFINAMRHNEASDENESNTIVLAEPNGDRPIAVIKQIVGTHYHELSAPRWLMSRSSGEMHWHDQIWQPDRSDAGEISRSADQGESGPNRGGGAADVIAILNNPIHTTAKPRPGEELEPLIGRETPA